MWSAIASFFLSFVKKGVYKNPLFIVGAIIVAIALAFLIPKIFGGPSKEDLNQKIGAQNQIIENLESANKQNVKAADVLEKTIENIQKNAEITEIKKAEVKVEIKKIDKKRTDKIAVVEKKHKVNKVKTLPAENNPPQTEALSIEISQIQIDSVWSVYCATYVGADPQTCKTVSAEMER